MTDFANWIGIEGCRILRGVQLKELSAGCQADRYVMLVTSWPLPELG